MLHMLERKPRAAWFVMLRVMLLVGPPCTMQHRQASHPMTPQACGCSPIHSASCHWKPMRVAQIWRGGGGRAATRQRHEQAAALRRGAGREAGRQPSCRLLRRKRGGAAQHLQRRVRQRQPFDAQAGQVVGRHAAQQPPQRRHAGGGRHICSRAAAGRPWHDDQPTALCTARKQTYGSTPLDQHPIQIPALPSIHSCIQSRPGQAHPCQH